MAYWVKATAAPMQSTNGTPMHRPRSYLWGLGVPVMLTRVWHGDECWVCGPAFEGGPVVRFRRDHDAELLMRVGRMVERRLANMDTPPHTNQNDEQ
jgi:hypothetical protein